MAVLTSRSNNVTQLIILAPEHEGGLDPGLAGLLTKCECDEVLVLNDSEEAATLAQEQGMPIIIVPFQVLQDSFVSQVNACTKFLLGRGLLFQDQHVIFIAQNAILRHCSSYNKICKTLTSQGQPCLFFCRLPADLHPLRLKTGFALIDLALQVRIQLDNSTDFGAFVPTGSFRTSAFPLRWLTYGIRQASGYAGMVRASHEGTSFVVEDHLKRISPAFASSILLHYEIQDQNAASRYVSTNEISSSAGILHFVPAYQKANGASVLFILLNDKSTGVFVDATLESYNIVLLLYPDKTAWPHGVCQSLNIPQNVMKPLERMTHMGREYVGPFRLDVSLSWDKFLAVLLAHNVSGDVDIMHHIPILTSSWTYDHATDKLLVAGGQNVYGRQSLPDIYSPEIAAGTANALLDISEDNAHMIPLSSDSDRARNSVHCFPCDNEAMAPGFLSALRNQTAEIFKMEAGITPVNLEFIEKTKKKIEHTQKKLCHHKIIMATKSMLLDQLMPEVAEMPLAKVIDVHSRYVSQAWYLTSELLGKRLPALHHAARPEAELQLLPRGFSHYRRFGAGVFKRPIDVMPTADGNSIWVTDCDAACVWRLDRQGNVLKKLTHGLKSPRYFIVDDGMFHLCDPFAQKMFTFLPSGKMVPFAKPMLLKFQGNDFWPFAGHRVGDKYLYRAMNSEFNVGIFLSDLNGANAEILVHAQPALYCVDTFDADAKRMVLAGSNERILYVYTFATREWQTLTLSLETPNITGLTMVGDCVLIRTPPQVVCYDLAKRRIRFNAYLPNLIGHCKWPFNAFRACSKDGQITLYIATLNNDIAAIELCKTAN